LVLRSHVPRVFNSAHETVLFSNCDSNLELTITLPGFTTDWLIEEFANRLEMNNTVRPGAGLFPTVSSAMPCSVDLRTSRAAFPPSDNGAIPTILPTAVTVAFLNRIVQQEVQSAVRNGPCTVKPRIARRAKAEPPHISRTVTLTREFVSSRAPDTILRACQTPPGTYALSPHYARRNCPESRTSSTFVMEIAIDSNFATPMIM
jgi:hypothetical protein